MIAVLAVMLLEGAAPVKDFDWRQFLDSPRIGPLSSTTTIHPVGTGCPVGVSMVLTAAHVVEAFQGQPIYVKPSNMQDVVQAEVAWIRKKHDLALLRLTSGTVPFVLKLAEREPEPGMSVIGLLMLYGQKLAPSFGTVYGKETDELLTSVMTSQGSSGSCLIDQLTGEVVGVNLGMRAWGYEDAPMFMTKASRYAFVTRGSIFGGK